MWWWEHFTTLDKPNLPPFLLLPWLVCHLVSLQGGEGALIRALRIKTAELTHWVQSHMIIVTTGKQLKEADPEKQKPATRCSGPVKQVSSFLQLLFIKLGSKEKNKSNRPKYWAQESEQSCNKLQNKDNCSRGKFMTHLWVCCCIRRKQSVLEQTENTVKLLDLMTYMEPQSEAAHVQVVTAWRKMLVYRPENNFPIIIWKWKGIGVSRQAAQKH